MKRILTVQDISCLGKCSLTVALPVISAMGVEAAILPTAVLSTHTMFQNWTCKDLTDQIQPITNHWKSENVAFSAIYTGYLSTIDQIDLMKQLFSDFKTPENFTFVDPAMGDHGRLYPRFDQEFASYMAILCAQADIMVPNLTEACFMTGHPYPDAIDESYVKSMLERLASLGESKVVLLTGIGFQPDYTGVMGLDTKTGEFHHYTHPKLPVSYHGTGDIFSSTCVGGLVRGLPWQEAMALASDFTAECIRLTLKDPSKPWYGVNFEQAIPYLIQRLQ